MKEKLTSSDPRYQPLPLNSSKVSRTPALSAVSEEEKTPNVMSGVLSQKLETIEGKQIYIDSLVFVKSLHAEMGIP